MYSHLKFMANLDRSSLLNMITNQRKLTSARERYPFELGSNCSNNSLRLAFSSLPVGNLALKAAQSISDAIFKYFSKNSYKVCEIKHVQILSETTKSVIKPFFLSCRYKNFAEKGRGQVTCNFWQSDMSFLSFKFHFIMLGM